MRTLKKVLALSLVFAMAFTLMAGAAYKDEDSINSSLRDDITLLEALGVFQGDENGNFNPEKNVTRAEAAKMIYVLKNNGVDDGAVAFQGVSKYSDVTTGFWAEGYINYCTNLGIMAGWSENGVQKFDPNGNVTGVELTKMLLCLVGYRADVQGYTNNNAWQANVLLDGANSGITTTYEPSVYSPAPRQWTARLLVNALNAPFVTYNRGEIMYGTIADPTMSYAEQYLGLDTVVGVLTSTNNNKLGTDLKSIESSLNDSEYSYVVTGTDKDGNEVGRSFKVDVDDALLGRQVKVYYKNDNKVNEEDNKVYAVLPYDKDIKVVDTTVDAVNYDSNNAKKVTVDGLGTKTYGSQEIDVYMNNVLYAQNKTIDNLKEFLDVNSNLPVTLVADKDGYINTVLIHELSAYGRVDKHDADKNTLSFKELSTFVGGNKLVDENGDALTFSNTSDNKDNYSKYLNVVDTVEDGDVVKITANTTSGELVYDITLADTVSGTPSKYTLNSAGDAYDKMTIDGTEYKMAVSSMALKDYSWGINTSVASDTTFYTDGKYVIYSEGGTENVSVDNLAYVIKSQQYTGLDGDTYKVRVLLSNGQQGDYTVANTYGADGKKTEDVTPSIFANGSVVSYSLSNDRITLKALKDGNNVDFGTATQSFDSSKNEVSVTGTSDIESANVRTSYRTTADTYFFVKALKSTGSDDYKYSVVKASEIEGTKTSVKGTDFAVKTVNGIPSILFGTLELNTVFTSEDSDYVFVNNSATFGQDGDNWVVSMDVLSLDDNGEEVTTTLTKSFDDRSSAEAETSAWNDLKGNVVTYTTGSDGTVEDISAVTINKDAALKDGWNLVTVKGWDGTSAYLNVGNTDSYANIDKDVKIISVDGKAGSTSAPAWVGVADDVEETYQDEDGTYGAASALVFIKTVDDNMTVTDIFFDEAGESLENITK